MFYELPIDFDFENPTVCICLEQNSIGMGLKELEATGCPACILNNIHAKDYVYHASELYPILSTNKVAHAEDTFCYRDYVCQISKLQRMYVTCLILLSVLKTTKHNKLYLATHSCTGLQW